SIPARIAARWRLRMRPAARCTRQCRICGDGEWRLRPVWPSASGNCRRPRGSSIVDSYPNDVLESPPTVGHYRQLSRLPRFTSSSSRVPEDAETIMVELSRYSLDLVREDAEFILYRAHSKQVEPPSILLLTPSSTRPSPETLEK